MKELINGEIKEVRLVCQPDSDPRAAIWVYEVADPDKDHFIMLADIIER